MKRSPRNLLYRIAGWALIVPILMVSIIGGSIMPVRTADGVVMVICSGSDLIEMVIDPATGKPVPDEPDVEAGTCPWATAGTPMLLGQPPRLPERHVAADPADIVVVPSILAHTAATGLPPSTGPPTVF